MRWLVVQWMIAILFMQNAYAQVGLPKGEQERFDGSQYNNSSFTDTDFSKPDYKELKSTIIPGGATARERAYALLKKYKRDTDIKGSAEEEKRTSAEHVQTKADDRKIGPVYDLPGDWVPGSIDLTTNGGFGIAPFNGSVEPYRLNGHVDIQRGRP